MPVCSAGIGRLKFSLCYKTMLTLTRESFSCFALTLLGPSEKLGSIGPWPVVLFGSMFLIKTMSTAM